MTKTEAKWVERVLQWKASGVGAEQFAQGKDYRRSTLLWYSTRLKRLGLLQDDVGVRGGEAAARAERDFASKPKAGEVPNVRRVLSRTSHAILTPPSARVWCENSIGPNHAASR